MIYFLYVYQIDFFDGGNVIGNYIVGDEMEVVVYVV